ncbi:hypothetical protein TH44_12500 [Thalassospira xiamenensis]|uniref:4,5-dihydroxyphthalate dehydrogenase n=2 Tax=Thalassospira xiamenensis TaxID=220697 RepID=A0A367XAB3_9PROT|nr:hypothetical protein TH44_12500 [Thalassospira xiamenensis]
MSRRYLMVLLGIVGLGAAAHAFLEPLKRHPDFVIAAVCDSNAVVRDEFAATFGVPGYGCLSDMLADGVCNAVYIGTPTDLHHAQVLEALCAGLHVLVEKPMAITVEESRDMSRKAKENGLALVVGHSHSHDLPIRKMREIILSGRLGVVRMVNTMCYTDWVRRPRRADELKPELGGGITYRQGAHQFDILCSLCHEPVVEVSANVFDWDSERSTIGAHVVRLLFKNGAVGTAIYNGYGNFLSSELTGEVGEWGFIAAKREKPSPLSGAPEEEELRKKQIRSKNAIANDAPHQPHFGLTIVSCERGDIRQSPDGLLIYTDGGQEEVLLSRDKSPRDLVLDEFSQAIRQEAVLHDGQWGAAIIEICSAALTSSQTGKPVRIPHC